jgi:3-methyladenine DNA glycosylase AlkC
MAEPLRNSFGPEVVRTIARMVKAVHPGFAEAAFVRETLRGYEALDLMARARQIARSLRGHLPNAFGEAAEILIASLGARPASSSGNGMAPFLFLPHGFLVAEFGLEDFEASMRAQYEITKRFTAEFSIRPFLERHPRATLARLRLWAKDPDEHVRRLVSEGTRPRLPWAPRLRAFQEDPRPVLELLELLKDDPSLYVRRSVANNLNDIGKDHPEVLVATAKRWMRGASPEQGWVVRHALRSAVKRGDASALAVLGFAGGGKVVVSHASIAPKRVRPGASVEIAFDVTNTHARAQRVLVDFRVHFVKARGSASPKVFKLRSVSLAPGETVRLAKKVSLAQMTTRKHYAGRHEVDAIVNGRSQPLGAFELS